MDEEHLTMILKAYAKFHATSMAMRYIDENYFQEVTKGIFNGFGNYNENFATFYGGCMMYISSLFDPKIDPKIAEKVHSAGQNCVKILSEYNSIPTGTGVMLHGDCWSNNFLIKYDVSLQF